MTYRLALIGFGTVGQGLLEILLERADDLLTEHGFEAQVVAVSDANKGAVYHPKGLDGAALLASVHASGSLAAYPDKPGLVRGWDSLTTIRQSNADVIIEATWTDLHTGQPAIQHIETAFQLAKHVVTSNKGPVALAYHQLRSQADARRLYWGIEGTVMSGTPALRLAHTALAGCHIRALRGILNGTTNFMLTRMEEGVNYAEALAEAQRLGYAEADPSADVEGYDALGKLLILAAVVMNTPLEVNQVARQGITQLTRTDVEDAQANGQRWKLIAELKRDGKRVVASVGPQRIPVTHPLAAVRGSTNAITYETDWLGEVTLVGPGAGRQATGFALLADLLDLHRWISKT